MKPWRKGGTLNLSDWSLRERVRSIGEIGVGEVLLDDSLQFDAHNLLRVTRIIPERDIFYGFFCDPTNPAAKRAPDDEEVAVHGFELQRNSFKRFYHVVPAGAAPSLSPDPDDEPLPDCGPVVLGSALKPYFGDWLQ